MGEECEILKHQADFTFFGRHMHIRRRHNPPVNADCARLEFLNPRNHAQRGRLAATGWPQQASDLSRPKRQGHILNHQPPIKAAVDIREFKTRAG